ncbi:MAG TPA: TraR/DksA C4-type zinc finger protein [Chitinophagaceae bacterium]|jgi:RNA polymerase-binding transcription factor DksA|nr:TraR/DksA C4-type zinc finger protein [Chitinophagaceae bacterium]
MATKKAAPKKAAKAAKPVKPAKKAAQQKSARTAKPAAKIPSKKDAPVGKKSAAKKPAIKKAAPVAKKSAKATQPLSKKSVAPVVKKTVPQLSKTATAKKAPSKGLETVKKPSIAAPSPQQVKPAIKPLQKPAAPKQSKPVVIPKTSTTKSVKYEPEFTRSVLDKNNNINQEHGPSMRYSDVELQEFRDLILKKLDTAKKELAYLQGLITRKDESGDLDEGRYMTMEDGSMSMEREQLSQMASRQIQFIDHLEKAMMRIENKTYGICRVTGKLIDKARLRAVPHATLSIEAKQMMNK